MPLRTIDTVVNIDEDRRLIVQLPPDVPTGRHRVVAVLDEAADASARPGVSPREEWSFPVLAEAKWPADMPLTREQMYGDNGR
jgi:hypothetical protein